MNGPDQERIQVLKNRIKELEIDLEQQQETLNQYQVIGNAADDKIKALNSVHSDQIRSLMNSIQLLQKANKQLEGLQKEHKRSQLIAQLSQDVEEQDLVIETLRKFIGVEKQDAADNAIIETMNKGPPKIRALSREQLKIQLEKSQKQLIGLKNNTKQQGEQSSSQENGDESVSVINESMKQSAHNQSTSSVDKSMLSDFGEGRIDSTESLIKRIEQMQNENDELRLNLQAAEEIAQKFEDDLRMKGEELNELRSVKTDFTILNRKYETLQSQLQKWKDIENQKYVTNYDKELRLEELEIIHQTHQSKMKMTEQNLRLEIDNLQSKLQEAESEKSDVKKELEIQKITTNDSQNQLKELNDKLSKQIAEITELKTANSKLETDSRQIKVDNNQMKTHLEEALKLNQELEERLQQKERELSRIPQGLARVPQSVLNSANQQAPQMETKILREKVRELTQREIDLQDQIEALTQEIKFREQREAALSYMSKKKESLNISVEDIKKKQLKEISARYDAKQLQLIERIKKLQQRNKQLEQLQQLLDSNIDIKADEDISSINSDISVSLAHLKNNLEEPGGNLSDIESIIQDDQKQLKKQLIDLTTKEKDLQNQVEKLKQQRESVFIKGPKDDPNFNQTVQDIKKDYEQKIDNLSKKVSELQFKQIRFSQMSSSINSSLVQSIDQDGEEFKNIDSNISLSKFSDAEYLLLNKKKMDEQYSQHFSSEKESVNSDYQSVKFNESDDINNISSGISNISGMSDYQKQKSNDDDYDKPVLAKQTSQK